MTETTGDNQIETNRDAKAAAPAPPSPPGPTAAKEEKTPLLKRPEVIAALIGLIGALSVPVVEHVLSLDDAPKQNAPDEPARTPEQNDQTVKNETQEQTNTNTQHDNDVVADEAPAPNWPGPVLVNADDSGLPTSPTLTDKALTNAGGYIDINGVLVEPLNEKRFVESTNALVYPEPSTLRQPSVKRFEQGDVVTIAGKVNGAPWYIVALNSGYGFIRTSHFSKETIGGDE